MKKLVPVEIQAHLIVHDLCRLFVCFGIRRSKWEESSGDDCRVETQDMKDLSFFSGEHSVGESANLLLSGYAEGTAKNRWRRARV
jgi:hypothetical protein